MSNWRCSRMDQPKQRRKETEIFSDLELLCTSPGYAYIIAYFCCRDNLICYGKKLKPENMEPLYSKERLIRTEISTLIGLMLKKDIDLTPPDHKLFGYLINQTETLLKEIHDSMIILVWNNINLKKLNEENYNPLQYGSAIRESIFYSSESAYRFQYLEIAPKKYEQDEQWFIENKGFSIQDATEVVKAISIIQNSKIRAFMDAPLEAEGKYEFMLDTCIFTIDKVVKSAGLNRQNVTNVIEAFSSPPGNCNQTFSTLSDFNIINAYPIISLSSGKFISFQQYGLAEAIYETPFYWLGNDKNYLNLAMKNRGSFTEVFCSVKLKGVFGQNRVFPNVYLVDSKEQRAAEIDVLVVYGDRAIILQAKSKRLTIEARKGNDNVIRDDFKKSIQDSYDQAFLCSKLLEDNTYKLQDATFKELAIPRTFKEIYIFCVVSDRYPALNSQTREFLKYNTTNTILPPFIMDIFALDVITEMLNTPLRFLSYVNRRVLYHESLMASDELTILSHHLKTNLWVPDKYSLVLLEDDFCSDLDAAMLVRHEGIPGESTPRGVLTKFEGTPFNTIIQEIGAVENSAIISLGFVLLKLGEEAIIQFNRLISKLARGFEKDGLNHDASISLIEGSTGLTIHCDNRPVEYTRQMLEYHCEIRKYASKTRSWYGININPQNLSIQFGVELNYPWEWSSFLDKALNEFSHGTFRHTKIGRNDPCPCGSGKKYKKCCIDKEIND